MRATTVLLVLVLFCALSPGLMAAETGERRVPVKIDGKSTLPLRVLSRPFANVYQEPRDGSPTVEENVAAFRSFFVYTRPSAADIEVGAGWYEVGTDNRGTVLGWMKADDVFEWKQTMCLAYTHPEGRSPVLMFEKRGVLEEIVKAPPETRRRKAEQIYAALESGQIDKNFPVISVEPRQAIDIRKQFYLLPILNYEQIEMDNREARILRLAAVTKAGPGAREASDIRANQAYRTEALRAPEEAGAKDIKDFKLDLVWVMDTTASMQPYIDQTLKMVQEASRTLADNPSLAGRISFGIWGYRDSTDIDGIGYTTHNYTPTLQGIDDFVTTLGQVKVTTVDSRDYPEDVFSGVADAMGKTAWDDNAMRFLILVGDAPAHEAGHRWNASGQSAETLRKLLSDNKIYVTAIHIQDPRAAKTFTPKAREQFTLLATNEGVDTPSYQAVAAKDTAGFAALVATVTGSIIANVGDIDKVAAAAGTAGGTPPAASDSSTGAPAGQAPAADDGPAPFTLPDIGIFAEDQGGGELGPGPQPQGQTAGNQDFRKQMDETFKAAFVEWIGSQTGAQAPRDITAWVVDKDLIKSDISSLEVRLLLNKRQLDSLRMTLETLLAAGRRGQISGEDFFSSLQAAAAGAARDPDMIRRAKSLAQTGLVPEFLLGLPYHSRIMDMNNELWSSWSIDEQDQFLEELETRMQAYETIHDDPEAWIQLNKGDDPDQFVYPISLDLLP